jgi:hypothetical protein
MATAKLASESLKCPIVWPYLRRVQVVPDLGVGRTKLTNAEVRSILLPEDSLPDRMQNLIILTGLPYATTEEVTGTDPEEFLQTDCVATMCANYAMGKQRSKAYREEDPGYRDFFLQTGPEACVKTSMLALRAWFEQWDVDADRWQWRKATLTGGWIKIPWHDTMTAVQFLLEGFERRYVATNHQMIPGITRHGRAAESRGGWTDTAQTSRGARHQECTHSPN